MSLPRIEEVTAPSGDVFQIWARDSTVHIDCSVIFVTQYVDDVAQDPVDQDTYDKYHNHNCHPEDEADAQTHFDALKAAIEAGDDLPGIDD